MRKSFFLLVIILSIVLSQPLVCHAHRVNIFAWTASGRIEAECAFSVGNPAQNSTVSVLDTATGQLLATGKTNSEGHCAFAITDNMRNAPKGLTLQVNAGSGHLGTWAIEASELSNQAPVQENASKSTPADTAPSKPAASQDDSIAISRTEIAALRADIASLHKEIASIKNYDPSWREIIGGLGWIAGLVGFALWYTGRRRQS